jgi:hypothetical protein
MNCFKQKNSSDTAFTNSDAGANGASDAAGGNWGYGTARGTEVMNGIPSPPLALQTMPAGRASRLCQRYCHMLRRRLFIFCTLPEFI